MNDFDLPACLAAGQIEWSWHPDVGRMIAWRRLGRVMNRV